MKTQPASMTVRRAASSRALAELKDVTDELAAQIRKVWKSVPKRMEAREQINALFGSHGVEYLGTDRRTGQHVYYCNAGDTYAPTILFRGPVLSVGTWGDLIERNAIKERETF
jgi:hypothetical protein